MFPKFKNQLGYLAKFDKSNNEKKEVFARWMKSDMLYKFVNVPNVRNIIIQRIDDEEQKGSGFQFQEVLKIYKGMMLKHLRRLNYHQSMKRISQL